MKNVLKLTVIGIGIIAFLSCIEKKSTSNPNELVYNENHLLNSEKQQIKVALLLDTSNSMDGLIDQAKAQLWEIVNELSYAKCNDTRPSLQIALYEYGNDYLNSETGYIRQVLPFSSDLDEISKSLFSLTTNGGNEFCGMALNTSLEQLQWGNNKKDLKLIFIAGNEPFTQGPINYKDASVQAKEKDISVNTIYCGDYNQGIKSYWKDGADLANGNYMAINHNQATVHIASPYDNKILDLNKALNKTYIAYGNAGQQKLALQEEQDINAMGYSAANAVSRAVSKSSHLYKNTTWDLVDAESDASFRYEDLNEAYLPEELKGKTKEYLKKYINNKRMERTAIQKSIQELNTKRKDYLNKLATNATNNLENAMIKAIKKQAKQKNYEWKR